jgi:hypothetical protein
MGNEADIINRERARMEQDLSAKLDNLGVKISVQHYTGDSSYPVEYTLNYRGVKGKGPVFEMALEDWLTELLKVCTNPLEAYNRLDASLRLLTENVSILMTDVSIIKAMVDKNEE